jgi:hypothetical protein
MNVICVSHLTLLHLIALMVSVDEYKLENSLVCICFHPPLLHLNIVRSTLFPEGYELDCRGSILDRNKRFLFCGPLNPLSSGYREKSHRGV